jgi:uncharacterized repeat protein (TIGR03803 family)
MMGTDHQGWIWRTALALVFSLPSTVVPANAQTFKVLHRFNGRDGSGALGQLVRDAAGNTYGAGNEGGSGKCKGSTGCGVAFKLNKNGKVVWLHSFNGANGQNPAAGWLRDAAGNLFGTTQYGGKSNQLCSLGCGVVFKLDKTGRETILHKLSGNLDGEAPVGPLIEDVTTGDLYGTTIAGGTKGFGVVFKMGQTGKETVLHNFTGADGCFPNAGVIQDASGNLYGTTLYGGAGSSCGAGYGGVYKIDAVGKQMVLHSFESTDGSYPTSVLLLDTRGNLYGTTEGGGNFQQECLTAGCGVVFELSPQSDGRWKAATLYMFCPQPGCGDGSLPRQGPLLMDSSGNLYGTTATGGADGNGVVFKLDTTTGRETVLHSFTGGTDGNYPFTGLSTDKTGNLYGTTLYGGNAKCALGSYVGCGVVFKLTP